MEPERLQTLGLPGTHPSLVRGMMAHAKIDPSTGEMFGFRQDWVRPFSTLSGVRRHRPRTPCFIQHVVNAYDDADGSIVLDAVRYPWYFRFDPRAKRFARNPLANLWRYRIDVQAGQATAQQLDDSHIELPRINEAKTGGEYRYLYTVEQPSDGEIRGVSKYDLRSGALDRHFIAPGDQNSEPIFVARGPGADEDDGWLLVCVYRHTTDTSDVLILDSKDIAAPPVATVELPRRIPAGFHGAWVSA